MATITKKELVDRIADELNHDRPRSQVKRVQVKRVVQKFLDMIIDELAEGNRLEFREFGVFESKLRAARLAQNPKTLERVRVPSKRSVKFKVGRMMKEKMAEKSEMDDAQIGDKASKPTTQPEKSFRAAAAGSSSATIQ
jgi:integration host factor subunit beta